MQLHFVVVLLTFPLLGKALFQTKALPGKGQGTKAMESDFKDSTGFSPSDAFDHAGGAFPPKGSTTRDVGGSDGTPKAGQEAAQEETSNFLKKLQSQSAKEAASAGASSTDAGGASDTPAAAEPAELGQTQPAAADPAAANSPETSPPASGSGDSPSQAPAPSSQDSLNPAAAAAASASSTDSDDDEEKSAVDGVTSGSTASEMVQSPQAPCSCDCCQVSKLLPSEFIPQQAGGQITSVCAKANAGTEETAENPNPTCPAQCAPSKDGGEILHASKGALDYERYCHYSCRPVTDNEGDQCVQFSKKLLKQASNSTSGNGKELNVVPVMGLGSGAGDGNGGDGGDGGSGAGGGATGSGGNSGAKPAGNSGGGGSGGSGLPPVKIVYDMRKLIAERLRSEAGAMVSAGASAAEQTRLNLWNTKLAAEELTKVDARTAKSSSLLEGSVTGVEAARETAEESERKTRNILAQSHNFARSMITRVKKLAAAEIKKAIEPCIGNAADIRAEGKNLDKPEDWVKVVAARAANPYQQAVTAAVQRTDEYKRLADGLHNQALAAQARANFLMPHINAGKAQGDVLGAAIDRREVKDMLARAKSLQAQAQEYWNTAEAAHKTIPKWQEAAAQAAAFAAWDYKANEQAFKKLPGN